ncbi:MAG: FAD:protein FMN transferase [Betaproteobacteria bacterium]|nr:FAD:protein FMN transferase [Betaproteobacteria bacterium]
MSLNRRDFLKLGLGACLLPGLGWGLGRAATVTSEEMYVFGTLVDVGVEHGDQTLARSAIAAVARDFQWQNQAWHAWKPGGLCELNAAFAAGTAHTVEPSLLPLLTEATELARLSGGLFNPAIGGLVGLWGFHHDEMPSGALPRAERIAALVAAAPSMDDLVIDGRRVSSRNPAVQLDLGGYAKGVALDRALDRLAAQGLGNAIVNLGGNLAVSGDKAGSPWRIGVRHPQGQGVLAALAVSGRSAVVTSGSYERFREFGGRRYPHIIDPRTGQPARHVASVTVIHPDAALADVAATALVVAGPEAWVDVARRMGVHQVMLVDGAGRVQMTAEMADRVSFVTQPAALATVAV